MGKETPDMQLVPHELRLSRSFDTGRSWEVPVALAHGLLARGHAIVAEPAEADLILWATGAVVGLSALLRASHDGYLALRIAGGIYLCLLGIQAFRSRGASAELTHTDSQPRRRGLTGCRSPTACPRHRRRSGRRRTPSR